MKAHNGPKAFLLLYICSSSIPRFEHFAAQRLRWFSLLVFERKTLKFLAVNEAASRQYGFSSREFLTMTIADIRPEDLPPLSEPISKPIHGLQEATIWRHRKKNGAIIDVEIFGHDLYFHGIEAELIAARDVTERTKAEE